jgi:hypothetical protein
MNYDNAIIKLERIKKELIVIGCEFAWESVESTEKIVKMTIITFVVNKGETGMNDNIKCLELIMMRARRYCWGEFRRGVRHRKKCLPGVGVEGHNQCAWSNPCHLILITMAGAIDTENRKIDNLP